MTPATVEDELEFFNVKEYALAYIERAQKKKRVNMVKIDSLLDKREEEISDFMEAYDAINDWYEMVHAESNTRDYQRKVLEKAALKTVQRERIVNQNIQMFSLHQR